MRITHWNIKYTRWQTIYLFFNKDGWVGMTTIPSWKIYEPNPSPFEENKSLTPIEEGKIQASYFLKDYLQTGSKVPEVWNTIKCFMASEMQSTSCYRSKRGCVTVIWQNLVVYMNDQVSVSQANIYIYIKKILVFCMFQEYPTQATANIKIQVTPPGNQKERPCLIYSCKIKQHLYVFVWLIKNHEIRRKLILLLLFFFLLQFQNTMNFIFYDKKPIYISCHQWLMWCNRIETIQRN